MPDWRYAKWIRLPREAYENRDATFHLVTSAAVGTSPFRSELIGNDVWRTLENELALNAIVLVAACLMPDHLHVVARPREANLQDWLGSLNR